jgi:hypothetical protein
MSQNNSEPVICAAELASRIENVILGRTGGTIYGLRVDVRDDGSVVLSGRTTTYYNKQLATHAAQSATRDCALSNQIEVE